ncbi:helix-turn-helix transcriptional regulator [Actinomadura sp. NPDC049382]|uniref:helix-turn-helix transcriptional regulator n=1 Tax=Actinomadura sp. NPDC049382 TaxID=3158220 RepID=UPI003440E729
MVRDDSRARRPRDFVEAGRWPHAVLAEHHAAAVAQSISRRLAEAMLKQRVSANRLASASGVNRQTIANVLAGTVWPDLMTVANLEKSLDWRLWPVQGELQADVGDQTDPHDQA